MAIVALTLGASGALGVAVIWRYAGAEPCTARDRELARKLSTLSVLQLHPGDSEALDEYAGCDIDDGFAYAGRRYRSAADAGAVVEFYRMAVPAEGWVLQKDDPRPVPPEGLVVSSARLCFTKSVEGTTGYLAIWFPRDFGDQSPEFAVEVTASYDGSAWC